MSLIKIINLPPLGDERGSLVSLESNKNIPFEIKRAYFIFDTKYGVSRGFHAHRNIKQITICVSGSCRFILDDGYIREEVYLDNPSKGLLIEDLIWREMHDFSSDCVLLVLANEFFNEKDYIRDYKEFIRIVNQ